MKIKRTRVRITLETRRQAADLEVALTEAGFETNDDCDASEVMMDLDPTEGKTPGDQLAELARALDEARVS
jgi:DNA primase